MLLRSGDDELSLEPRPARTRVVESTLNPEWLAIAVFPLPRKEIASDSVFGLMFRVRVMDHDDISRSDLLGEASIAVAELAAPPPSSETHASESSTIDERILSMKGLPSLGGRTFGTGFNARLSRTARTGDARSSGIPRKTLELQRPKAFGYVLGNRKPGTVEVSAVLHTRATSPRGSSAVFVSGDRTVSDASRITWTPKVGWQ